MLVSLIAISAQSQSIEWKIEENFHETNLQPIDIAQSVSEATYLTVDYQNLVKKLRTAPEEFSGDPGIVITIPMPDGRIKEFYAYESSVMQPGISARYPNIKSYKVVGKNQVNLSGRIGFGSFGFHATIRDNNKLVYIDRYSDEDLNYYISYYTSDFELENEENSRICGVEDGEEDHSHEISPEKESIKTRSAAGDRPLKTYRLALACTGEWGDNFADKEEVLAQMNIAVNKVNEIMEYELGIRMILVDDNDKVIYTDGNTDPYNNPTNGGGLLGQNNINLNVNIGIGNYDIGHIYTIACNDVGGIASLASVCTSFKGQGCTCNYSSNITVIAANVTSHEMGHQLSATHTFNNCNGNESFSTAFEPGAGNTIMSYAGSCGPQLNVGPGYLYFHGANHEQMYNFTTTGNGADCVTLVETENFAPTVELSYIDGFYIPVSTPFMLDGEGFDENGDDLLYSWEEMDSGPQCIPGFPIGDAPQFVTEVPDEDPLRIFPEMQKIILNTSDKTEVLPFYNKDMTFRLTVRDGNGEAGASSYDEVQFFSTEEAGPFEVVFPNTPQDFVAGQAVTIEWDVANTNGDLVNCQAVDIFISKNGGYDFQMLLKGHTPNDGSEEIILPDFIGTNNRFMVKASENIFFDISNTSNNIVESQDTGFYLFPQVGFQNICLPQNPEIEIFTSGYGGLQEEIVFDIADGLPDGATYEFSPASVVPGEPTILTIITDNVTISGLDTLQIRGIAGQDTIMQQSYLNVVSSDFSELATINPPYESSGINTAPTFEWAEDNDAEYYIFEISDDPGFENGDIVFQEQMTSTVFELPIGLSKNTVYFWRVTGYNNCGLSYTTDLSTFATESLSCQKTTFNQLPFYISTGTPTYDLEIPLVTNGEVSDVNVRVFQGGHGNFKQLEATLISPAGTEVLLFKDVCFGLTTFNCGFDSDSPTEIDCPLIGGQLYQPIEDLSIFNGENIIGNWTLRIKDNIAGDGGQINDYQLEVCSNASLAPPVLEKNKPLPVEPDDVGYLNKNKLVVSDENNDPDEITFKLVTVPTKGDIELNGEKLFIGNTFTQDDLNNSNLIYRHNGVTVEPDTDEFLFIVDDSEGGWIGITQFIIDIDMKYNTSEILDNNELQLYPNPTSGQLTIDWDQKGHSMIDIQIHNILGQQLMNSTIQNHQSIDVSNLPNGMYIMQVRKDGYYQVKEFQIYK